MSSTLTGPDLGVAMGEKSLQTSGFQFLQRTVWIRLYFPCAINCLSDSMREADTTRCRENNSHKEPSEASFS